MAFQLYGPVNVGAADETRKVGTHSPLFNQKRKSNTLHNPLWCNRNAHAVTHVGLVQWVSNRVCAVATFTHTVGSQPKYGMRAASQAFTVLPYAFPAGLLRCPCFPVSELPS
jgi:hypothetical protein